MSGLWRLIKGLLVVVLVSLLVLVVAFGGLFSWLVVRGMPQRDGIAHIPSLSANVRVVRDQYGIPNIYASSAEDLFAAQGYVHASERMWQMEVWRRIGAGRLSELFGAPSLDNDRYIRMLGWRQAAERDWQALSDEGRLALESYAAGVNAWLDQHGDMPLPFVIAGLQGAGGGLAGFQPEPWTPIDTLTWQKVQAWSLGDNMGSELLRQILLNNGLSTEQIDELVPAYDPARPIIATDSGYPSAGSSHAAPAEATQPAGMSAATAGALLGAGDELRGEIATALGGASLAGSNGFVVAPSRSATGSALLANDPHLDISMPSLWYLVGLHCQPVGPDCPYDEAGAGFPGVPGLVLGHNERIAWGLTNVGPDVQDVFEERVDPADASHYMYKGKSRPFDVRTETIKVAGGDDVSVDVRSTVHGPVVSDLDSAFQPADQDGADAGRNGYVYALAWTAIKQPDKTLDAVLGVNRAADWDQFRAALRDFGAPSQTFLYADDRGNIGVQIPGLIPIRKTGNGAYIVPGEDGAYDWTGFVPFDELPNVYNPSSGLIVAANNQPVGPDYPYLIGREFDPGWRAARIHELLDGGDPITTDDLRAVQGDVKLTRAAPVLAALRNVPTTPDGVMVRELLDSGSVPDCTIGSAECAAFEVFEYWLERGVFGDELGAGREASDGAWRYIGTEPAHEFLARLMAEPDSPWWDDVSTPAIETQAQVISAALDRAAGELRAQLGEPAGWTWGAIHTVTFEEQTLGTSGIGPLEWIFNRGPLAAPGSCTTVEKICGSIARDWPIGDETGELTRRFAASSSPSYRLVVDLGDLDGATIIQTTGQSGVPFDGHYGDFIERWLANEPLPLPWTSDAVDAAGVQTLTLEP